MPITARKDGVVSYQIEGKNPPTQFATNRQKKLLRFFGVRFGPTISAGAAGWEIGIIMSAEESRWRRYLFLTNDYGANSEQLVPHDAQALLSVVIPDEWSSSDAAQQFKDELIAQILHDESPFDFPMPYFTVAGHVFIFTDSSSLDQGNLARTPL
jgi:hypothetical protein